MKTNKPKPNGPAYDLRPAPVTIDDKRAYPALIEVDGQGRVVDWNGWVRPWFRKKDAERLAKDLKGTYDRATDSFTFVMDSEGETDTYQGRNVNGRKLYPIGNCAWIWSEVEPEGSKPTDQARIESLRGPDSDRPETARRVFESDTHEVWLIDQADTLANSILELRVKAPHGKGKVAFLGSEFVEVVGWFQGFSLPCDAVHDMMPGEDCPLGCGRVGSE